ncbi:hypothetical protein ACOME3_010299 [Neoechinorhynchus agilis]
MVDASSTSSGNPLPRLISFVLVMFLIEKSIPYTLQNQAALVGYHHQPLIFGNSTMCYYCKWCGLLSTAPSGIASCPANMNRCITVYRNGMILRGCADDKCLPVGLLFSDDYQVIECCIGNKCNNWVLRTHNDPSEQPKLQKSTEKPATTLHSTTTTRTPTTTTEGDPNTLATETSKASTENHVAPELKVRETENEQSLCRCQPLHNAQHTIQPPSTAELTESSELVIVNTTTIGTEATSKTKPKSITTNAPATTTGKKEVTDSAGDDDTIDLEEDDIDTNTSPSKIVIKPMWRVFPQPADGKAMNIKSSTWMFLLVFLYLIA